MHGGARAFARSGEHDHLAGEIGHLLAQRCVGGAGLGREQPFGKRGALVAHLVLQRDDIDGRYRLDLFTAAWGDPVSIYFTCGVEVPAASALPCQSFQGFDWLIDDTDAPFFRLTVFGREPASQVYFNSEVVSSAEVLGRIGKAAQDLPLTGACTDRPES